jgi:hypothetical protein
MKNTNRFGLSRTIPAAVRLKVRQRSGFGCVICGAAIIVYHHFNPRFVDAHTHNADGITILCPLCHAKVECCRISSTALLQAIARPFSQQVGYSSDNLEVGGLPTVMLGGLTINSTPIILEVNGRTIIGFNPPELSGAPFRLNALFCNIDGKRIAEIVNNEWRAYLNSWDVETVGLHTTIRSGYRDIALEFRIEPPSKIIIERLNMFYKGLRLEGREGSHLNAFLPNGDLWFHATNTATITGCCKAIVIN